MNIDRVGRLLFFLVATVAGSSPSPAVADLYVQEGIEALDAGDSASAAAWATRALEFYPQSSDANTLQGLLGSFDQSTFQTAIEHLERALAEQSFSRYEDAFTAARLATLYNHTGDFAGALATLDQTPPGPSTPFALRADLIVERIRALYGLLQDEEGDLHLARARDLFPNDARLLRFALGREPLPSFDVRREIERLIAALPGSPEFDGPPQPASLLAVLLDYGLAVSAVDEKIWATDEYLRLGGNNPRVATLLLDADPQRAATLFGELGGSASLSTIAAFDAHGSLGLIDDQLADYSGLTIQDADLDGLWELEYTVVSGLVSTMRRDRNQDGSPEIVLTLSNSEVVGAEIDLGAVRYRIRYQLYPYVHQVAVVTELGTEEFTLRPRSSTVRLVDTVPTDGFRLSSAHQIVDDPRIPSVAELRQRAVRIDQRDAEGRMVERIYQAEGAMVLVGRDENHDGEFDVVTAQDGGLAVRRVRDIDFDGYFELVEEFRGGRLVARAIDEDDDRFPEILEYERPTAIREWDLNQDGRIDVKEFLTWSDSVIREFPLAEQE